MNALADWQQVNLQMIAKSLQELSYEQVLVAHCLTATPESAKAPYELNLKSGVTYHFTAWRGIWTDLKVDVASIRRNGELPVSAGQFFIDIQTETGMDDIILANFLEEMHNTLYGDQALLQKNRKISVEEISTWNGEKVQSVLQGHPKLLLNKGRMGWSAADQDLYGPEHQKALQMNWLAVHSSLISQGLASGLTSENLLRESMQDQEFERFQQTIKNIKARDFIFVPVHPWQWERYLKIHFAAEISQGQIIFLGAYGDLYLPQISLRTFSNISRPEKMDIKLPLTILNTSAIRGIPGKYIAQGPDLSSDLAKICATDQVLNPGVQVLEEKAGYSVRHALYSQLPGAPYRYQELLGVLWRQSSVSKISTNDKAIIAGSLFHRDAKGESLIGAYIRKSQLPVSAWLRQYFKAVVIPLYHLQLKYGIGLVAHGQNVVVHLKNYVPSGILLKDFQGDLRLSQESQALSQELTRLPAHYLIHDLITGHFVTVLRFVSETLQECDGFSEKEFYKILGEVLKDYLQEQHSLTSSSQFASLDLLQKSFHRVLVNKVRFKIGYADSAERPLPILGDDILNPISLSLQSVEVSS